ncbi:FecR family protein [Leptolyngbya sp. KIOST-1]|uniref:FecR family protein n=1 Tax=Leptolyngbya sp. KIOST-1 TaxID=1229172 RepID=UPI001CEC4370|nr:FecR family protein [Leptolyngbya sp. KIOST-1]
MALVLVGLPAQASVTLTRADVEALRNRVEFIPRGRQPRSARMSDFLAVGDALRTAAASQADLRFNDGSLARVGERATFRFVPNTRNFRLNNGTVLLLIPPGRGRTTIQTPSAVTGIQGSAVVVRYVPENDLTVVMALTNNPSGPMTITASGCADTAVCAATEYSLYGGQMALIQNNQVQVVEFDLPMFYQTSPLVEGLELDNPDAESPLGPVLEQVREETLEALQDQTPFTDAVILDPSLIGLDSSANVAAEPWLLSPASSGVSPVSTLRGVLTPGEGLGTTAPINPVGSQPVQPPVSGGSNPAPATPNPGNPANPNPGNPANPNPGGPANPNPGGPANPNPGGPANPNPGGPANPNPGGPANPNPGGPANPNPGGPANPNPGGPANPNPGGPANPNPGGPANPNPGGPANPNPGGPANPNPGGPANPNPGGPANPNPGGPANPNPGGPANPNPGGPANPNPGGPANPGGPGNTNPPSSGDVPGNPPASPPPIEPPPFIPPDK